MAARFFGRGFASGALTSFALYSVYSYILQPKQEQLQREEKDISVVSTLKDPTNILKYGAPDRGPDIRCYTNHALGYDQSKRTPLWVAEHITQADLKGSANRKKSNFVMDPNIHPPFASQNSDYKRSGWSRGHMSPAGDNKYNQTAMDESFFLSNIVPQDIDNNRDFWNRLEIYCRNLVPTYKDVWVITGPLTIPNEEENGKKYVKYEVVGKNNVAVPTHLYKLITVVLPPEKSTSQESPETNETIAVGAFVVPNQKIPTDHNLKDYQVPLENLQANSGLRFFSKLEPGNKIRDLCDVDSCNLMSQDKFQLYFIGRRLQNSTTIQKLDESWKELEKRKLKPDIYLNELYQRKKVEFESEEKEKNSTAEL